VFITGTEVMVTMKAYLDGSGGKDREFLVLAGVAASDRAWGDFENKWREVLAKREGPKPRYLHMNEIGQLKTEYAKDQGWTDVLAGKVVTDCPMYDQTLDKKEFRLFICHVDMEEHKRLEPQGRLLPDAYELCVHFSQQRILKWYLDNFAATFPQELHYYLTRMKSPKDGLSDAGLKARRQAVGYPRIGTQSRA
jgi:hypothetical protein